MSFCHKHHKHHKKHKAIKIVLKPGQKVTVECKKHRRHKHHHCH